MELINLLFNFIEVVTMITIIAKPVRRPGIKRRTRRGGGRPAPIPTATEQELKMSLPANIRNLSVKEVLSRQSVVSGGRTFRPSGGRLIPEAQFKAIQKQEAIQRRETIQKQEAIKKQQLQERVRKKVIIEKRRLPPKLPIRRRLPTTLEIRKEKGFFVLEAPLPREKGKEIESAISEAERIRLKLRTKIERGQKLTVKENLQLAGAVVSKSLLGTGLAIKSLKKVPEKSVKGVANLIKNPQNIKKVPSKTLKKLKKVGKGIKAEAGEFGRTLRVSPTEAVALVGTEVLLFAGSGKALKVVGKLSKASAKPIKKIIKKEGRPVKFIGVQEQVGDKIITKVIFSTSKKKGGVAIGISMVRGRRVGSVTFGKVGKFKFKKVKGKRRLVGFKQKGVFAGREAIRILKGRRLKIVGKSQIGRIVRNVRGLTQVGLGQVAVARGRTLLETGRKFGVGRPVPKKVKGLKIEKFISISAVLTKKDLSLIVGKTLKKKRDIKSFIGLIKGQSSIENVRRFSIQKQRLFKQAFLDVAGTVSASTTKGRNIIPKLSPKSRNAIISRVSKARGVPLTVVKGKLKQVTREQVKVKATQKLTQEESAKLVQLEKQVKKEKGKLKLKEKVTQKEEQKSRQILRQRSRARTRLKQRTPLVPKKPSPRIGIRLRARVKIPARLKRRKRRIVKKPLRRIKQAYEVRARPLKVTKKGRRPKLIKVSKVPLSKKRAKDLRNYITDTSLSRTAKIKPIKGKPKSPRLRVPKGYSKKTSKKFRRHKRVKGKRIPLPKGKVIERRKHLLDTRQEKKQITLRRRIKQISKPKKRKKSKGGKTIKRRPTRRDRGIF